MQISHIVPFTFLSLLFLNLDLAAQTQPPAYLKEYQSKGLPPLGQTVEFENKAAFPPQIKGQTQTDTKLEYQTAPGARAPEALATMRDTIVTDAKVRNALGKQFQYLGSEHRGAMTERGATAQAATTVMRFYSYARNRVVDVEVRDDKVVAVRLGPKGFQPAEGREEVAAAAALVRADTRYSSIVADLPARGLITPSKNGHRYLYVLFYKEKNVRPPVFRATVDMTAQKVVSTRALTQPHQ